MGGSGDAYLIGGVDYPEDMGDSKKIYRNIENEPLINKIKALEEKLVSLTGDLTAREALKETEEEIETGKPVPMQKPQTARLSEEERKIYEELLDDFNELLKVPYGPLGYLVKSTSEDIIKFYGVDTDRDFWTLRGGSAIRLINKKAPFATDKMAIAGGRRWAPYRGLLISDPEEMPENIKQTDEAIQEIVAAIKKKLASG